MQVDTSEESASVTRQLDESESRMSASAASQSLLTAPFLFGPRSSQASRFRPIGGAGVFYSAFDYKTALIEKSWHQLTFLRDMQGQTDRKAMQLTVFGANVATTFVDINLPPHSKTAHLLLDKVDYSHSQLFAQKILATDVSAIKYKSVRNSADGVCLAILRQAAILDLAENSVDDRWWLSYTKNTVHLTNDSLIGSGESFSHTFE